MSSEWREYTFEQLKAPLKGAFAMGPFGSNIKAENFTTSGVPVIKGGNLNGTYISEVFADFLTEDKAAELTSSKARALDIVITHRGTLGQVGLIPEQSKYPEYIVSQSQLKLSFDRSIVDPYFIYYFLRSPIGQQRLLANTSQVGVPAIAQALTTIRQIRVDLPGMSCQSTISNVLRTLDDRITLLRETNATLEAIAQALFKSWFVDFDPVRAKMEGLAPEGMDEATAALFPDSFEESELGLVPMGWRVATLEDCCSRVESGGTPKRAAPEYWGGDISWLTSGEVRSPIVFDTKEKITALGVKESSAKLWPSGTTVVAMYGATAGEVCLLAQPSTANQACCGLIPLDDFRTFLFFCVRREGQSLASKSSGSAQQNLNKGLVCGHPVLVPSIPVVAAYENVAGTLLDSWIENEAQAQTLATLRDTLLPRLISGQLGLPEVQAASAEALA